MADNKPTPNNENEISSGIDVQKAAIYMYGISAPLGYHGYTIAEQRRNIRDYCKALNFDIAAEFCDEKRLGRNSLKAMRLYAQRGGCNVIIVDTVCRLGRDLEVANRHIEEFIALGVGVISVKQGALGVKRDRDALITKIKQLYADHWNSAKR